ncbi:MAG: DUF6343 family protein [Jiangellaceae bacterium]
MPSSDDGYEVYVDPRQHDADRERYEQGLDDYHDPTAGIGGASPARSALTLRLWLAGFGCALFVAAAIVLAVSDVPGAAGVFVVLAVLAAVNLTWVAYRKGRGEPG